jgi:hypothetical protein
MAILLIQRKTSKELYLARYTDGRGYTTFGSDSHISHDELTSWYDTLKVWECEAQIADELGLAKAKRLRVHPLDDLLHEEIEETSFTAES